MKKNQIRLLLLFIFIISGSYSASAQIIVGVRPPPPIIVRPPRPSRTHVWINEEWEPNGKEKKRTRSERGNDKAMEEGKTVRGGCARNVGKNNRRN